MSSSSSARLGSLSERRKANSILARSRTRSSVASDAPTRTSSARVDVTDDAKREPKLAGELGGFGNEVDRAGEQIHGRRRVRPLPGANACAAEPLASGRSEIVCVLVVALKLCQVPVRLLEVVAHELVRPVAAIEAFARKLVQLGALRFRDAAIRDVAHEHMVEAEDVLHRTHQTSFGQVHEMSIDIVVCREVVQFRARKATADHGGSAHDSELSGIEAVETAGEQRFHGRRCLVERQLRCFLRESKQLLGEQRVAARLLDDPLLNFRVDRLVRRAVARTRPASPREGARA